MTRCGLVPELVTDKDAAERRRRAARLLGELLPETTSDERGPDEDGGGSRDADILRELPPHYGRD